MLRASRSSRGKSDAHEPASEPEMSQLIQESIELERALMAMDAVSDGQIDEAAKSTSVDSKSYTQVATGVSRFIEATVSFETEAIHAAVSASAVSEHSASKSKNSAQESGLQTSSYRPGAEFESAEQESSSLGAISMSLTENKSEISKASYKIRKTYISLEDSRKHVKQVNEQRKGDASDGLDYTKGKNVSEFDELHAERTRRSQSQTPYTPRRTLDEYVQSGVEVMAGSSHLILSSIPPNIARLLSVVGSHGDRETALEMSWHASSTYRNIHGSSALIASIMFFDGQSQYQDITSSREDEDKISDKIENKAGGMGKSASSNTSDRTKSHVSEISTNGSINGSAGAATRPARSKTTAKLTPRESRHTREHSMIASKKQREYYPHGVSWLLQEGRLEAHEDLVKGVGILESPECGENQMRQVEGSLVFDRTMFSSSLDRLEEAAESFIDLMSVSSWSHPSYMYLSAACHLESYRSCEDPASEHALKHKMAAEKWFLKAPEATGKKKVLGRKMPFDGFVSRKVAQFKASAKEHRNTDFADVIATSPSYEALYFWNGQSRMTPELADIAVGRSHYSASTEPRPGLKRPAESSDDMFTRESLEATYARRSSSSNEGYNSSKKLTAQVVSGDVAGTGSKKVTYHAQGEPWAGAACLYERAIYEWLEYGPDHAKQVRRWLDLSADWPDDYELSTRINMKITGARDRLDIYRM